MAAVLCMAAFALTITHPTEVFADARSDCISTCNGFDEGLQADCYADCPEKGAKPVVVPTEKPTKKPVKGAKKPVKGTKKPPVPTPPSNKCEENEVLSEKGRCVCDDESERWPAETGECVAKCEQGWTRNETGDCEDPCGENEAIDGEGDCVCLDGFELVGEGENAVCSAECSLGTKREEAGICGLDCSCSESIAEEISGLYWPLWLIFALLLILVGLQLKDRYFSDEEKDPNEDPKKKAEGSHTKLQHAPQHEATQASTRPPMAAPPGVND